MRYSPISRLHLLCFLALASCADHEGPVAPQSVHAPTRQAPRLAVRASDPRLRTLVIEVDGAGFAKEPLLEELLLATKGEQALLYNIQLADGYSDAPLSVLAGPGRRVVVRGHDSTGALTHQGETYLGEVLEGEKNAPLSIALQPVGEGSEARVTMQVVGQAPREATIVLRSEKLRLEVGGRVELRAEVLDREGRLVPLGPDELQWALSDPREGILVRGTEKSYTVFEARLGGEVWLSAHYYGTTRHVLVEVIDPWVAVTAGSSHSCALRESGKAYCWGSNYYGQLGDGTTTDRLTPVPVGGGLLFRSIDAGYWHSCGVTTAGAAYCWGRNAQKQLGIGPLKLEYTKYEYTPTPVPVYASGLTFATIEAGPWRSCALTAERDAYCWGESPWSPNQGLLVPSPAPLASDVASVSVGRFFTCVTTTTQRARCVGDNSSGQIGDGTTSATTWPTSLVDVRGQFSFASVTAGLDFACALSPQPGLAINAVYCWGTNALGQLGNRGSAESSWCGTNRFGPYCAAPELLYGWGTSYEQVSAGGDHACAITSADDIHCWGSDARGQLGDGPGSGACASPGSTPARHCKVPAAATGGHKWSRVSAGGDHSCAITLDRLSIYCWGAGANGQIGDGTLYVLDHAHAPVKVATPN